MTVILSVLIILCCIVLILAVLVQNPKGGGLASGFTSGAQVMGVRRTADFLEKATWTLAVLLFVFSIATSARPKVAAQGGGSETKDKAEDLGKNSQPTAPKAAPFGAPGANPGAAPAPAPKPPGK